MRVNLKLSRVGMSMQEATIVKWHKQPGETFNAGDPLYEIETEKVTQEVPAPSQGTLLAILVPEEGAAPWHAVDRVIASVYRGGFRGILRSLDIVLK